MLLLHTVPNSIKLMKAIVEIIQETNNQIFKNNVFLAPIFAVGI